MADMEGANRTGEKLRIRRGSPDCMGQLQCRKHGQL